VGSRKLSFFSKINGSWVVWSFDAGKGLTMLSFWEPFKLTDHGKFFSEAMRLAPATIAP